MASQVSFTGRFDTVRREKELHTEKKAAFLKAEGEIGVIRPRAK